MKILNFVNFDSNRNDSLFFKSHFSLVYTAQNVHAHGFRIVSSMDFQFDNLFRLPLFLFLYSCYSLPFVLSQFKYSPRFVISCAVDLELDVCCNTYACSNVFRYVSQLRVAY